MCNRIEAGAEDGPAHEDARPVGRRGHSDGARGKEKLKSSPQRVVGQLAPKIDFMPFSGVKAAMFFDRPRLVC